jgi:hypothetical protein
LKKPRLNTTTAWLKSAAEKKRQEAEKNGAKLPKAPEKKKNASPRMHGRWRRKRVKVKKLLEPTQKSIWKIYLP